MRGDYKRYYVANREAVRARIHPFQVKHRQSAIAAYGARCAACGWDKAEVVLHVHHIDSNRKNGDLANLIVLCPTCHYHRHFLEGTGIYAQYLS